VRHSVLETYYEGLKWNLKCDEANMYLAEDRILGYAVLTREGSENRLSFVKKAYADTEVPYVFNDVLKQRRRWINGKFFVQWHVLKTLYKLLKKTNHSRVRKIVFLFYGYVFSLFMFLSLLPMPAFLYVYYHLLVNTNVRWIKNDEKNW
jgi:chitin synthase